MDFIQRFCATIGDAVISPPQYLWWSAAATVSAIMGRLIWTHTFVKSGHDHLYGNLFVLLVGPPGIGKTNAVREGREVVIRTGVRVGPDDISGERLYEELIPPKVKEEDPDTGKKVWVRGEAKGDEGTICLFLDEFDTLMHGGQAAAAKRLLNHLYDCRSHTLDRKTYNHGAQEPKDLCGTIIAGVTPAHLQEHFGPLEWQEGLPSRFIYVWGEKPPFKEQYARGDMNQLFKHAQEITKFISMTTSVEWSAEGMAAYTAWCKENWDEKPRNQLLRGYDTRRALSTAKLAFVLAVSDLSETIQTRHLVAAQAALAEAEADIDNCLALAGGNKTKDVEGFLRDWLAQQREAHEWQVRRLLSVRVDHHMVDAVIQELVNQRVLISQGPKVSPNRTFKGGKDA